MRKRPLATACLFIIGFLFLSTRLVPISPPAFMDWEGKEVTVIGDVYAKETYFKADKKVSVVYLKMDAVLYDGSRADIQAGDYRVICYLKENQTMPHMGSIVTVTGRMQGFDKATNPGQFDAKSYYQILKISFQLNQTEIQQQSHNYHKIKERLYTIRRRCGEILDRMLAPKDASVMKTMLLGEKKAVDAGRKELYQKSGIAHILAISGLHISLIGMTLFRLLRRLGFSSYVSCGISVVFLLLYGFMIGFSVSVIRAIGMFLIHMLGRMCRRTYDMITAVAVMAVLVLAEQPLHLYNSSFWLSFGCVLAIALLIPALTGNQLKEEMLPVPWIDKLAGGAAVTIAMLPMQLCFFYQIPVYSTLLNLLVIPMMSLLLPVGMLLLILGSSWSDVICPVVEVLIKVMKYLITGILIVYDLACNLFSKLPLSILGVGRPDLWRVVCYFAILIVVVLRKKLSLKKKWLLVCSGVLLLLWPVHRPCSITFLDVGQGDGIHIQSKTGNHYLIDGGSSSESGIGEYRILPYLKYQGITEIETVFVTHADEDHCNGILELFLLAQEEGIHIKSLCLPDISREARTKAYQKLVEAAMQADISVIYISAGMSLQDGDLRLQCLHPYQDYRTDNENAYSLVLLMQYEDFEVLFTGDVEGEGEEDLVRVLQELICKETYSKEPQFSVEVLKVAHHGSRYSTTEAFLELIHPQIAVISCGENNFYGHPHKETLARLEAAGCAVLTTPQYGAITVEFEKKMKIYGYR